MYVSPGRNIPGVRAFVAAADLVELVLNFLLVHGTLVARLVVALAGCTLRRDV